MITLRPAHPKDLPILQYWDTQAHVIASDPDEEWDWEYELNREPPWREQLMAELDGRPLGFVQIIDPQLEESHYWGEIGPNKRAIDIWIGQAEDLGKGYGTQMMRLALEKCFYPPEVEEVLIDPLESNTQAIRFYQKLGFIFLETRVFGEQVCAVHSLKKENWGFTA